MLFRVHWLSNALLLSAVLALAGCMVQPVQPERIPIGAVVPLTGGLAGGGEEVERGYQIAVDDINAAGGVYVAAYDKSLPLELTILDDESDPNKTVANLELLNTDRHVVAYLGGFGSGLHAAAAAIAEKNKIPYLGVAFALYGPHSMGYKYLFSPFPKSQDVARGIFAMLNEYIPEDERPARVAVFQEQTEWGYELGNQWREEAPKAGYEIVVYEEYVAGSSDYTAIILRAKEAEVDMVLALPSPSDGIIIYQQMAELDFSPKFSYFARAPGVPAWTDLGAIGDYVTVAPGWHNGMTYPGVAELNQKHMELTGRLADTMVGPAYAVVQILADAIERAGRLDRDAIRDAIAETDMEAMIGPVSFREDGTGIVNAPILQHQHGQIELVYPREFATADLVYPAPPFSER